MKTRLMMSLLASVSGLGLAMGSGLAAAQEVGKVISSTPVLKRVTEPKTSCTDDAQGQQRCRTEMVTEDRNIGYKVVYEYAGRQREVQLPFPPGNTIELEVTPRVAGAGSYAPEPEVAAPRSYSSTQSTLSDEPVYVERVTRVVREPVYIERSYYREPYYADPYYGSGYYSSPVYPVLGLALGLTAGYYATRGYGWGGRGWNSHGYRGGGRGHR